MGDSGTCGFCGTGGGYLGDQGDEGTQYLNSTVVSGPLNDRTYEPHPEAHGTYRQFVTWCGSCDDGLKHKYQRMTTRNLTAMLCAYRVWAREDPILWNEFCRGELYDDPGIHIRKVQRDDEILDMNAELQRRVRENEVGNEPGN